MLSKRALDGFLAELFTLHIAEFILFIVAGSTFGGMLIPLV